MDKGLESVLSSITSNKELMEKISKTVKSGQGSQESTLADVISLISPIISDKSQDNQEENDDAPHNESAIKSISDSKDSFIESFGKSITKNSALLIALKPYLSKERCQMIDGILRISQLTDIIKLI